LKSFDGFGLNDAIARAIAEERCASPAPIQIQTIPIIMSHRDLNGVSHVVSFDLPNVAEPCVYRIGHPVHNGTDGIAISFCDREEPGVLRDIAKLIGKPITASGRRAPAGCNANADRSAGPRRTHTRPDPRQRQDNNAARPYWQQKQAGEFPEGIASVAFLRTDIPSPREGALSALRWSTHPKGSRYGQGRTSAV
jgi:superfamily II DNA/RNA helicase